ncbi:MAG: phenylalanine--tRNA ligase subunit beta [Bacteroidales bacterium]|nr:phenylalanine--tRNA ligase subunit beta [Bacteroidales bacterium]MDD3663921.1 phenylalanine--tRNA ligase subunit beta [Bacteroidales bacterium]
MKISYKWLRQYITIDLDAVEVASLLTESGLEVESIEKIESVKGGLNGVVIGQVMTCSKHPNSDHLSLTTVNVGLAEPLNIVCGASNVAAGQKVVVATIGTTLYFNNEPLTIKRSKIRGEASEGMICAEDELGLGNSHDGIMVLPLEAQVGMAARDYFNIEDDFVFEIGLTPNRTDATSHIGVARDLNAALVSRGHSLAGRFSMPDISAFKVLHHNLEIQVEVKSPEACPRYAGISLTNVEVAPSPDWLRNFLTSIGIRPINNVVDITNFVLMETGQPLHAFDASKISTGKVVVQKLAEGTRFVTLDGVERSLTADDLMICNGDEPMCIGGVFGGFGSGVTEATTSVFLESACFDQASVRRTSKHHGLHTDASFRFERGVDPTATLFALQRAAQLMVEWCHAEVASEIIDVVSTPYSPVAIPVDLKRVASLIGKRIDDGKVLAILKALDFKLLQQDGDLLLLESPSYRVDVTREADVTEEILRIYGYNNIEIGTRFSAAFSFVQKPDQEKLRNRVSDMLSANGFNEIMTLSLTKGQYAVDFPWVEPTRNVELANPLSRELNVMRQTLLFSGLETVLFNQNRRRTNLKLYEFGRVYKRNTGFPQNALVTDRFSEEMVLSMFVTGSVTNQTWKGVASEGDFYFLHSHIKRVLGNLGFDLLKVKASTSEHPMFSQGIDLVFKREKIGSVGIVNKKILKYFDIKQPVVFAELYWEKLMKFHRNGMVTFAELPKYPEVKRDLALVLDKTVTYSAIEDLAYNTEPRLLQSVSLFDIYEGEKIGEGKKSYALTFTLLDSEKTLTDQMIEKVMQRLIAAFENKLGAVVRK